MFDWNLRLGVELYKMLRNNPNIRDSVFGVIRRVIEFTLQGRYDPLTLEFDMMSPRGEWNKIFMVLKCAEYREAPLPEFSYDPHDSSAIMVNYVNSLYQAILGHNSEIAMFVHYCPTLATNVYALTNYIYQNYYKHSRKDLMRRVVWDSFDHFAEGDFIITGHLPVVV